jgi:hypothetical protein
MSIDPSSFSLDHRSFKRSFLSKCTTLKRKELRSKQYWYYSSCPFYSTCQKIHDLSRHNPLHSKHLKYHDPQLSRDIAMDKKMICSFPTLSTHTTPIYHPDVTLAKFSKVRIFSREAIQVKKANLKEALVLQMLFREKGESTLGRTL